MTNAKTLLLTRVKHCLAMELKKQNFLKITNQHRGIIRSLCKIYFGSVEDQKDAFQDVILQLWKSFDSFRGDAKVSTWIYRVSLNTILVKVRKEKKQVVVEPIDRQHFYLSTANADDDVELLHLIIQSLKDIDKALVILHLEGYKNKEIAEMLDLSPTNVSTRFNRIKSQLKTKYNQEYHASK